MQAKRNPVGSSTKVAHRKVRPAQTHSSRSGWRGGKAGSWTLANRIGAARPKKPAFAADIESTARRQQGGNSAGAPTFEPGAQPFHGAIEPATAIRRAVFVLVISGNDLRRRHLAYPSKSTVAHQQWMIVRWPMCGHGSNNVDPHAMHDISSPERDVAAICVGINIVAFN